MARSIISAVAFASLTAFSVSTLADDSTMPEQEAAPLRVMSFNIRYNNPADGPNAWPHRRDWVADIVRERRADLVGMQEALPGQIADLEQRLPGYAWYGVGRDDGKHSGEHTPIFYRKNRLELLDRGAFWLSERPEQPGSKSWDTAITRVAVWAKFRDRTTGQIFFAFNTHFDHLGKESRRQSAKLILRRVREIAADAPVVLTGDFNCTPASPPYKLLVGDSQTSYSVTFRDARTASRSEPKGPSSTWNGFERIVSGRIIDFIFVTSGVDVLSHATIDESRDVRFPSDHLPVLAAVRLDR